MPEIPDTDKLSFTNHIAQLTSKQLEMLFDIIFGDMQENDTLLRFMTAFIPNIPSLPISCTPKIIYGIFWTLYTKDYFLPGW